MAELALFFICILCVSLIKSYKHLSVSPGDSRNRAPAHLYRTLKHLDFVRAILEGILIAAFSLFAINAAFSLEVVWSFPLIFAGLILVFIVLPKVAPTNPEIKLAELLSRPLSYLLDKLKVPIAVAEKLLANTSRNINKPEPISREALKSILQEQINISKPESAAGLRMAIAALQLDSEKAGHFMVRLHKTKFVSQNDKVGPVLLSELHDSGRKVFPVKDKDLNIVGIVQLDSLSELKTGGKVGDVLSPKMIVVNTSDSAMSVIRRFNESAAEIMFAKDETGEPVGVIYLEDVLAKFTDAADD